VELHRGMYDIAESDWKIFKRLREVALGRFCERALADIDRISADAGKSHHERYLEIWRLIEPRDRELVDIFDHLRRSTAVQQLLHMQKHRLVTAEELSQFSPALRDVLAEFAPKQDA
jgi:hypothetical protein